MEALVEKLLARRSRIRELIEGFGRSDRKPFPKWGGMGEKGEEGGRRRWGTSIAGGELRGQLLAFSFQLFACLPDFRGIETWELKAES
jgi:hypothetical protein